jgi:saccharopine dehydrogenase-like NADP-dependent oxidoreductase
VKVGVLGSGLMGSVIAWDLARSHDVDEVVVADASEESLARMRRMTSSRKLTTEVLDVRHTRKLAKFLREFDAVASALPHGAVNPANRAAIQAGAKMVDIAFEDEQMKLATEAKKKGALLIPGCGLAPGLAGILLANGARLLDEAVEGHIFVGGLPQHPKPPLEYRLVFSLVGLLREYLEDARLIRDGKIVKVKPFETLGKVIFSPPIGKCESFCTDGLATLLYTMKDMKLLDERTVRWPGHAEKIQFLIDMGLFSTEKMNLNGAMVSPFDVSSELLSRLLRAGPPEDVTVMRVEVAGRKGPARASITYEMVDYYDKESKITSMGKTTGFTCSIVTRMVGKGDITGTGVIPPEVALTEKLVKKLQAELQSRGVKIGENQNFASVHF